MYGILYGPNVRARDPKRILKPHTPMRVQTFKIVLAFWFDV